MKIEEETVDKIASLAKLEFNGTEKKAIMDDMNKMIDFVDKLSEVDTNDIDPLIHISESINALREDSSQIEIDQKEALLNAPKKDSTYFKIPKVLDK